MNTSLLATHIVILREGSTVLCAAHANAMLLVSDAADIECDIFPLLEDEDPIHCQACRLAEIKSDPTKLPH